MESYPIHDRPGVLVSTSTANVVLKPAIWISILAPRGDTMPEQQTLERAREDAREGKSPTTQAGEFVREEIDHVREGKHGAASVQQAIAIGLSKARRAGIKLPPPAKGPAKIRAQARRGLRKGKSPLHKVSRTRSRATLRAL